MPTADAAALAMDPPIDPVLLALSPPRAGHGPRRRSRSSSARKSSVGDVQVGSGLDESMDELGRDDEPYEDLSSDADADGDIFVEDDSSLGRTPNGKGGKKKQRKGSLSSGKKAGAMSKQARRLKEAMGPKGVGKAHIGKKGPEPKATSCENCRSRKIKCSRHANCVPCQQRGDTCIWRTDPPIKVAQWASTQAVIDENHAERDRLRRIVQALSARYSARELAAALREGRDPREPPTLVDIPLCEQKTGKQTQGGKKKASPLEGAAGLLALALPHGFDGSGLDDVPVFDELQLPNPPPDQVDLSPYKLPQSTQLAPSDDTLVASATAAANGAGSNTLRPPSSASKSSSQPPLRIAIPADPSSGPPSLTSALPFTLPGLSTDGRSRSVTEGAPTRPASPTAVAAVARDQPPASRPPAAQPAPHYPSYPSSLAQPPRPAPPPLPSFPSRAPPPTFFYPILPSPLMSPRSIASLANKRHAALISQRDPRNRLARMMVHEQRFDRAMEKARAEAVEREKATLKGKRGVNGVDGNGEKGAREQERPAAKGTSPASPEEQHFAQQAALAWAASNGIAPASTNIASTSTSASAPNDTPTASSSPAASSAAAPAAYAAVEPYRPLARDVDPPLVDPLTERRRSSWLVSPVTGSTTGAFALLTTGRPVLTVDAAGATASAAGGSSSMSALFRTPSALTSASSGGLFGRISLSPMRSAFPHSAIEEGLRPFSSVRMPGDEGDEMGDERFEPRMESVDEWARFEPRQANEGERAVAAQAEARTVVEEEEDECAVEQADERGMETEDRKSAKSTRGDDEAGSGESDGDE